MQLMLNRVLHPRFLQRRNFIDGTICPSRTAVESTKQFTPDHTLCIALQFYLVDDCRGLLNRDQCFQLLDLGLHLVVDLDLLSQHVNRDD